MLVSSISFSLMALCAKWACQSLPSLEVVFFRSLIGTCMTLAIMFQKKIPFFGKEQHLMILRGLSGFMALSLYFYTLGNLPIGTAVLLNYTSPILAALFAVIILKEKPGLILLVLTLISFIGIYLLAGETGLKTWSIPVVAGLVSAVFAGVAYIMIRAVKYRESPLTIMFYFTSVSTVGSIFFLPFGFKWPGFLDWIFLAGVAVGSFYGQLWMTIAFRRAPASVLSPLSYLTPLLSLIYGVLFFRDPLTAKQILGAFLIIGAGSAISFFGTQRKRFSRSN